MSWDKFLLLFLVLLVSFSVPVFSVNVPVSGNGFSDIQNAIDVAGGGDVVRLENRTYTGVGVNISVTVDNLVFEPVSGRATLDAQGLSRIFLVSGNHVTFRRISFVNGDTDNFGGAILVSGTHIRIEDCVFVNNKGDSGAAIAMYPTSDNGIIINSRFIDNNAVYGGRHGGAIDTYSSNLKIDSCDFINNSASTSGAIAIYNNDNTQIIDCNFTANKATIYGGAIGIVNARRISIEGSVFNDNTADSGGAIESDNGTLTITGSTFNSNNASYGGGISSFYDMNISSTVFVNNKATNSGGAIYSNGRLNIRSNSQFNNNRGFNGGAIYSVNLLSLSSSIFSGNNATGSGGAIFISNGATTISSATFNNNRANSNGGAIRSSTSLTVSSSTFYSNKANNGGGIYSSNTLIVNRGTFNSNTAKNGGGIYSLSSSRITSSKFYTNKATNNGGAVYSTGVLNISSGTFGSNVAKNGGGIFSSATLRLLSSRFSKNIASANGGGIYSRSALNITGGSIVGSTAKYGSGIYSSGTLRLLKVSVSANKAKLFSVSLSTPTSVKYPNFISILAGLVTGDNIANVVYSKNSNVWINGKVVSRLSHAPSKNIVLLIEGKKYSSKSNLKGISKLTISSKPFKKSSIKVVASFENVLSKQRNVKIIRSSTNSKAGSNLVKLVKYYYTFKEDSKKVKTLFYVKDLIKGYLKVYTNNKGKTTISPANNNYNNHVVSGKVNDYVADLNLTVGGYPNPAEQGGLVEYKLIIRNLGNLDAKNVLVKSNLPKCTAGLYSVNRLTWHEFDGTIKISKIAKLQSKTIYIRGRLNSLFKGSFNNTVGVATETKESNYANNLKSVKMMVLSKYHNHPPADLKITIIPTPNPVIQGSIVTYNIYIQNKGPGDAYDVKITSILRLISPKYSDNGWKWVKWNGTAKIAKISKNTIKNVHVSGMISSKIKGKLNRTAIVTSSVKDLDYSNNKDDSILSVLSSSVTKSSGKKSSYNYYTYCGASTLQMLLAANGIYANKALLVSKLNPVKGQISMYMMSKVAKEYGITLNPVKTYLNSLKKDDIVLLNISGNTHYVNIIKIGADYVIYNDPDIGPVTVSKSDFSKWYTGYVLSKEKKGKSISTAQQKNLKGGVFVLDDAIIGGSILAIITIVAVLAFSGAISKKQEEELTKPIYDGIDSIKLNVIPYYETLRDIDLLNAIIAENYNNGHLSVKSSSNVPSSSNNGAVDPMNIGKFIAEKCTQKNFFVRVACKMFFIVGVVGFIATSGTVLSLGPHIFTGSTETGYYTSYKPPRSSYKPYPYTNSKNIATISPEDWAKLQISKNYGVSNPQYGTMTGRK